MNCCTELALGHESLPGQAEVSGVNFAVVQDGGAFHYILQFAHVAWPGVAAQRG